MGDNYKTYESFYSGGLSNFGSEYGFNDNVNDTFVGKHMFATKLGFPGSAQTANQLKESINAIKQGVKAFEVTMVSPETADMIPKQHFEEMRALMKLSGVTPSVHAPIVDPAGFERDRGYTDESRIETERKFFDTLAKAKQLNAEKGTTVVFHSSSIPGTQYVPDEKEEDRFHTKRITLVDKETGQIKAGPQEEKEFRLEHPEDFATGGTWEKPLERIDSVNLTQWREKMTNLANLQKMTDEVISRGTKNNLNLAEFEDLKPDKNGMIDESQLSPEAKKAFGQLQENMQRANIFVENTQLQFQSAFHTAYKYGTEHQREDLKQLAEDFKKGLSKAQGTFGETEIYRKELGKAITKLDQITTPAKDRNTGEMIQIVPSVFENIEKFAQEKASQTFGNVAWKSFNELAKRDADKAPVIAIENVFNGMTFSKAEELAGLIQGAQDVFVKKAVADGMEKDEAKKAAKKLIGATWDVGHLNVMKKEGFTDKDLIEQTKKIAPFVKHVHLTDNFGYGDSHLAPGMGNVPFKKILEELEKTGRLKEMGKIVEAPSFVQHFQKSPHGWTLAALGSPVYGAMMSPYWNQVGGIASGGGYFGGQGYLPEKHFSIYGSGFSSLPTELGGQVPGTASRATGTPMA